MPPGLAHFMVHEVELLTPTSTTTRYGDTVPDWSQPPASTATAKGWFTLRDTDEESEGREGITDLFELTLDIAVPVSPDMRVIREGATYEIRGSIRTAQTPSGPSHHILKVRRVQG